MSLRFQSALNIENLPDEQIDNQFEVIMPTLNLEHRHEGSGWFTKLTSAVINSINEYTPIVEEIVFGVRNFKQNTRTCSYRLVQCSRRYPKLSRRFHYYVLLSRYVNSILSCCMESTNL